jgi:hypothetical protein
MAGEHLRKLESTVLDLQCKSMKNSLVLTGLAYSRLCELQKGCTRLAAASDKAYQLLAHGRWLSPGSLASSTTKTGRHDIADKHDVREVKTSYRNLESSVEGIRKFFLMK